MKHIPLAAAAILASAALSHAATLTFDFGDASITTPGTAPETPGINNFTTTTTTISNPVIDGGGNLTGVVLTLTGFNTSVPNTNGAQTPTENSALASFSTLTTRDSLFGNTALFNGQSNKNLITLAITGLDPSGATQYSFEFAASRTGVTDNRETKYTVTGFNTDFANLDAANNVSNTASVLNITPTAEGTINITMEKGANNNNSSSFIYINGMRITAVPEPTTALLSCFALIPLLRRRR